MPLSWTTSCSLNCSCSAFLKVLMGHFRMKRYSTSAINSRAKSVSVAWVFNRVPILSISMSCLSIRSSGNVRVSALRPAVFGCSSCNISVSSSSLSSSSSIAHYTRVFSSMAFCCFLNTCQSSLVLMPLAMLFLIMNLTMPETSHLYKVGISFLLVSSSPCSTMHS